MDSLQDFKSEYSTYEDIVVGKIKEGFHIASLHPFMTAGVVLGVGFLGLKSITRQFLSYKTMRLFLSEETLVSRADARVKELQQSIDRLKGESEKLEVNNLAKEAKKERNALSKEVTKINNYGISV
ncbi:hypothetical protein ACS0TY_021391 [Phlomoides rotata]